jgi:5'-nucleotidase
MSEKPIILVTNDDGVSSPLLRILADRLSLHFSVRVVAPASEQSWIGKAINRRGLRTVREQEGWQCPAWSVDGTPADCVNLALGNLLRHEKIAAVVSGINIGYNASLPLILSSGTVGGALEGALWGLPALALSQALRPAEFRALQFKEDPISEELADRVRVSADHAGSMVRRVLGWDSEACQRVRVLNVNFPVEVDRDTCVRETTPLGILGCSVYRPIPGDPGTYGFEFKEGQKVKDDDKSDLNSLMQGHITLSLLDFSSLAVPCS